MCSQIIAVMYLDKLNHFIKEKLKIKKYVLYMDDGVLFHYDKEHLKFYENEIKNYLIKLKLELNEKKTRIDSIKNGLDLLGFKFYIQNNKLLLKVRNSTKKKFKKKMKKLNKLYIDNKISLLKLKEVYTSYNSHLSYGNCKNLLYNQNIKSQENEIGEIIAIE